MFLPFEVIEQGLDWYLRAAKHRSSAKNGPIFDYDFHPMIVPRAWVQIRRRPTELVTLWANEYDYH